MSWYMTHMQNINRNKWTNEHMILCYHETRQQWRVKFLRFWRKFCNRIDTHHQLIEILISGLVKYFNNEPMAHEDYPTPYRALIISQNKIGWYNLLRGRFLKEWSTHQTKYAHTIATKNFSGENWIALIIWHIWQKLYDLWLQINEDLPSEEPTGIKRHEKEINNELEILYRLKDKVHPVEKGKFRDTLQEHQKATKRTKLNFIKLHAKQIRLSARSAITKGIHKVHAITRWFTKLDPNKQDKEAWIYTQFVTLVADLYTLVFMTCS